MIPTQASENLSIKFLNSHVRCVFLLLTVIGYCTIGISQSFINKTASSRAALGITESKGYNFKIVDGQITSDSILAVTRKFNGKGFRTETCVYKGGTIRTTYQFGYENDTLLINLKTFKGPEKSFMAESIFEYDKNLRLVKQFDPDTENGPNLKTKNKYNKLGQRTRTTFKARGRKLSDDRFKYNERGLKAERISCVPTKERFVYTYDDFDRLAQVHKVFKDRTKSLIEFYEYSDSTKITKHILHDTHTLTGINGAVRLSHSDVLTTEKVIGLGEQTLQETEYLNGRLNGFRKYYYRK
ncbi:MAG: hypothetical protein ACJA1A_003462 [Saprospiraceae bacterium]|jgi:hypothetical protein